MRSYGALPLLLLVGAALVHDIYGQACVVNLLAWGKDDPNSPFVGYITLNGATVVNTSLAVANGHLGFYITTLNPTTCTAGPVNYYDIYNVGTSAATALAQALQGFANGTTVLGVTADTPNSYSSNSLAPAVSSLQSIGIANAASLVFRSKVAFIAVIGNPSATNYQLNGDATAPVQITYTYANSQPTPAPSNPSAPSSACGTTLDYLMRNYVLPSACSNSQGATNSPPATCPPPPACPQPNPPCLVNLLGWGKDDSSTAEWVGHITLNGATVVDISESVVVASGNIGFYITTLNPATCTAGPVKNYDIYDVGTSAATALAQALQGFANGTIVLGVTADTPNSGNSQNLAPAIPALVSIGITTASSLVFRSQLAFIAEIGNPSATVYQLNGDATAPAQIIISYR
jgi:hypothetical protein